MRPASTAKNTITYILVLLGILGYIVTMIRKTTAFHYIKSYQVLNLSNNVLRGHQTIIDVFGVDL